MQSYRARLWRFHSLLSFKVPNTTSVLPDSVFCRVDWNVGIINQAGKKISRAANFMLHCKDIKTGCRHNSTNSLVRCCGASGAT